MSGVAPSPLLEAMERAGGVRSEYHGRTLVRHFGDPAAEYEAATKGVAVFDRSHRTRLTVSGREPGRMLSGILTGTMPQAPRETREGVRAGWSSYHAVLTPKGKMLSDAWLTLLGDEQSEGFLLDVPVAGREPLLENLRKLLPPRLARLEDVSEQTGMVTLVGPESRTLASRLALDGLVPPAELAELGEGEWRMVGSAADRRVVLRTEEVWPDAYSVLGTGPRLVELWAELAAADARPAGLGVWSTLRVEAGRPVFGTDMDDTTIPLEAGIEDRAIDHEKGCYTGQEVVVRIRDRGHVNRYLRRLELGDVPTPTRGTELLAADDTGKVVGSITSAVQSPKQGGVLALAYVRRGVNTVTLDGREIAVPT